ncbi:MAG: hypothetical protein D6718_05250 [Acidobacteria bacterium]|nr:MAG: hypothetical protein D6718_05250 [Acidobacteriota bacterium]
MRRSKLHSILVLAAAGLTAPAPAMPPGSAHQPPRAAAPERGTPLPAQTAQNLLALHDPESDRYDGRCLACHQEVMERTSADPRVPSFHVAMVPYTPGYNPAKGTTDAVCIQCHKYVELEIDSSGALRKHVDPELCALCHGPSGPGPVFYMR